MHLDIEEVALRQVVLHEHAEDIGAAVGVPLPNVVGPTARVQ